MKKNYNVTGDGHYLHARIGFEIPMADYTTSFFVPGQAHRGYPRISTTPEYEAFPVPGTALAGSNVPIIYHYAGYAFFGQAKWGVKSPTGKNTDHFRNCEDRALGLPGPIPASFIDLAFDPEHVDDNAIGVRLRPSGGGALYLACTFTPNNLDHAANVTLLVSEPGPDIAPYTDWQPTIIHISKEVTKENSDFIFRRDNGRLQVPSPSRSVKVEKLLRTSVVANAA